MTSDAESGLPPVPRSSEPMTEVDGLSIRAEIARELRSLADKLDGGPVSIQELIRGRHFAPYGSEESLCGAKVDVAPDITTGEYSDDRYTIMRARTTCAECLALMDPIMSEGRR